MDHRREIKYLFMSDATDLGAELRKQNSQIKISITKTIQNKIAFQQDAYRPLVDRISVSTAQGGGSAQEGCLARGDCLPMAGLATGGWCLAGGGVVCPASNVSQHAMGQTSPALWTHRHV